MFHTLSKLGAQAGKPAILLVRWQSGYAEDCNSLYVGSIPVRTSINFKYIGVLRHFFANIFNTLIDT